MQDRQLDSTMNDTDEVGYDSSAILEDVGGKYGYSSEESDDDHELTDMSLGERWQHVIKRLIYGEVSWDIEGDTAADNGRDVERRTGQDSRTDMLDTRMKKSLAEVDPNDKNSPTILHILAESLDSDGFKELACETRIKIVEYLLQERRDYPQRNRDEEPILTKAIRKKNAEFIFFILEHCKSHLPDLLDARHNRHGNCLHYLFKTHFPDAVHLHFKGMSPKPRKNGVLAPERKLSLPLAETIEILGKFVKHAKPSSVTAQDEFGNTPVHYAMEYKICRMPVFRSRYPKHVLALIETGDQAETRVGQFNKDAESPYLFFERTKKKYLADLLTKTKKKRARGKADDHGPTRGSKGLESRTEKPEAPNLEVAISGEEAWPFNVGTF